MRSMQLLALVTALVFMACSSAGDSPADAGNAPDGGSTASLTVENLCRTLAETICAEAATCSCPGVTSAEACLAKQQPGCERSFSVPISGVALGRLTFDPAAARACVDAYAKAIDGCATPNDTPPASVCARIFIDAAAVGANCHAANLGMACANGTGACADSGACVALPASGEPCPGRRCAGDAVCLQDGKCGTFAGPPNKPSGATCGDTRECAEGLSCQESLCAPAPVAGAECNMLVGCGRGSTCIPDLNRACAPKAAEGESCVISEECAEGLGCHSFLAVPKCVKLAKVGEPCTNGAPCVAGARCEGEECRLLPVEGESCSFGECAPGFICDGSSKCTGPLSQGAACGRIDACAADLVCNLAAYPGTCVARVGEGQPCEGMDDRCLAGHFCDQATSTCQKHLKAGDTCSSFTSCGPGAECIYAPNSSSGTCTALGTTVGATCGNACGGGLRCTTKPGQCVPGLCGAL